MRHLLLVLSAALTLLLWGCSDDNDDASVSGLPEGIPTFTGAEQLTGVPLAEDHAFLGSWRTSESVQTVREYFERELQDGWHLVDTQEIDDGVLIRVEDSEEPNSTGAIIVRREDGSTRIVKTIEDRTNDDDRDPQDQARDDVEEPDDESEDGDEVPAGYPADVPLPDDAQVTSSSAPTTGQSQYYLVEFNSGDSPAEIIAYFNYALTAEGWEAGAANDDPDAFVLNYSRGENRVIVTGGSATDGTEASVTIIIES